MNADILLRFFLSIVIKVLLPQLPFGIIFQDTLTSFNRYSKYLRKIVIISKSKSIVKSNWTAVKKQEQILILMPNMLKTTKLAAAIKAHIGHTKCLVKILSNLTILQSLYKRIRSRTYFISLVYKNISWW